MARDGVLVAGKEPGDFRDISGNHAVGVTEYVIDCNSNKVSTVLSFLHRRSNTFRIMGKLEQAGVENYQAEKCFGINYPGKE